MSNPEVRNAAEALLGVNYPLSRNSLLTETLVQHLDQLSSTHNSLSSLEGVRCDESGPGAQMGRQMSVVRRFFCLFVLFDLLLISLTWLICIMLMDSDNIVQILKMQVLHYTISKSLFDVVLAAFSRFTVLLLFYGLLQLNTTFFVAFTTLGTCVFLIFKVVYYSWSTAGQSAFQVILVLISFIITWAETWFLDFHVLPQEKMALNYAQSTGRFTESLSTLLLDRSMRSPVIRNFLHDVASTVADLPESTGNYYSPLESPNGSDDEGDDIRDFHKHPNSEFARRGKDTLEVAWSILNDCDWNLQKKSQNGDCVYSKHESLLGKLFLLRARINMPPQRLLEELFLHVDKFTLWNKSILESRRIKVIDEHTDITYQVSAPGGNGIITSRDFVNLRHWDIKGDTYVLAAISIPYPSLPPTKNYTRGENGPCCWAMRPLGNMEGCMFEFLLNTNLKGWIPKYVLESALTTVLLEYSEYLREYCRTLQRLENT